MLHILTGNQTTAISHEINRGRGITYHSHDYYERFSREIAESIRSNVLVVQPSILLNEHEQYQLGIDLCSAKCDVFLFTHSSSLINGIRVGVKRGYTLPTYVEIIFYTDHEFEEIQVDSKGNLSSYPDGLLDTWEIALLELLKP